MDKVSKKSGKAIKQKRERANGSIKQVWDIIVKIICISPQFDNSIKTEEKCSGMQECSEKIILRSVEGTRCRKVEESCKEYKRIYRMRKTQNDTRQQQRANHRGYGKKISIY